MKKTIIFPSLKNDTKLWDDFALSYHELVNASLNKKNNWYSKRLIPSVLSLLKGKKESKILDFGCGDGYLSDLIFAKRYEVIGYDISKNMLQIAKKRNSRINFIGNETKLYEKKYSSIILNMVIHDIKNYCLVLTKLMNCLENNGQIILSIPHPCFYNSDNKNQTKKYKSDHSFYKFNEKFTGVRHYHRSIEKYFSLFYSNGFYLSFFDEIYDWSMGEIPHCMLLVFKKLI